MKNLATNKTKKGLKGIFIALALTFTMLLSSVNVFAIDIGDNPHPKVDIAVNVPDDYPGTFLDFKTDLMNALEAAGLDSSLYRITNTMINIDTSDLSDWYVYDHYYDSTAYNYLKNNGVIKGGTKQPFRQADNSQNGTSSQSLANFNTSTAYRVYTDNQYRITPLRSHTYSYTTGSGADLKSNMLFGGYGTQALVDFMLYPASSDSKRSFSFDMDGSKVYDALDGAGFLVNAEVKNNHLSGYLMHINAAGAVTIFKENNVDVITANSDERNLFKASNYGSLGSITWPSSQKIRLSVELTSDKLTVQYQPYNGTSLGSAVTLGSISIPQFGSASRNGFGPCVCYTSHGCTAFTTYTFNDLVMTYQPSCFDALKSVNYSEDADQKYFINLAGASGNPQVNYEDTSHFNDGMVRMDRNEVFYISNVDDGHVLKNNTYDGSGNIKTMGNGVDNGTYVMGNDFITLMAQYITTNYNEHATYTHQKGATQDTGTNTPAADFTIRQKMEDGTMSSQVTLVHLQHLGNQTLKLCIKDKSLPSMGYTLNKWHLKVTDPSGAVYGNIDTDYNSLAALPDVPFTSSAVKGVYTFELTVTDSAGRLSIPKSAEVLFYKDDRVPQISVQNITTKDNKGKDVMGWARITITDTGDGIDADGKTIISGQGSGIKEYCITEGNVTTAPTDGWEAVPGGPSHTINIDIDFNDYINNGMKVWAKDECGNLNSSPAYTPCRVVINDYEGFETDSYIVLNGYRLGKLPTVDDSIMVEKGGDGDDAEEMIEKYFGGFTAKFYATQGATPSDMEVTENTILNGYKLELTPIYTTDPATVIFDADTGNTLTSTDLDAPAQTLTVDTYAGTTLQRAIDKYVTEKSIVPNKVGYSFTSWKYKNGNTLETVSDQRLARPSSTGVADSKTLVAQYTINNYKLNFDPNGGTPGAVREEDIQYNAAIASRITALSGRQLPQKDGYIFKGWGLSPTTAVANIIKSTDNLKMGPEDKTVYAVWAADTSMFRVTLKSLENGVTDSNASADSEKAYTQSGAAATGYNSLTTPTRSGYKFEGWYYVYGGASVLPRKADGSVDFVTGAAPTAGKALKVTNGTSFNYSQKSDHVIVANWTPDPNTKYTVQTYINAGGDPAGTYTDPTDQKEKEYYNYTYQPMLTATKYGTTEKTATLGSGDIPAEITVNGVKYWYNPNAVTGKTTAPDGSETLQGNVTSGTVIGSPFLTLKVYYDRYFSVNTTTDGSEEGAGGTITATTHDGAAIPQGELKEGESPHIEWAADANSYVKQVWIDGKNYDYLINDDLTGGSYDYPMGIHRDGQIKVIFGKKENQPPEITPQPDPDHPGEFEPVFYEINTRLVGNVDGKCTITGKQRIEKGNDARVILNLDPSYQLVSVTADGMVYDDTSALLGSGILFSRVRADHEVVVTVEKLPEIGGDVVPGQYTITVNQYGGADLDAHNSSVYVSPSRSVDAGDECEVSWYENDKYEVFRVVVDGEDYISSNPKKTFRNIKANHVVSVYFREKVPEGQEPVTPSFRESVSVKTQLLGAAGTISSQAMVEKGSNYTVRWTLDSTKFDNDPESLTYTNYTLESVKINDVPVDLSAVTQTTATAGEYTVSNIQENTTVKVTYTQVKHTISLHAILNNGVGGSITTVPALIDGQTYVNIKAIPEDNYVISKIILDGDNANPLWTNPNITQPTGNGNSGSDTNGINLQESRNLVVTPLATPTVNPTAVPSPETVLASMTETETNLVAASVTPTPVVTEAQDYSIGNVLTDESGTEGNADSIDTSSTSIISGGDDASAEDTVQAQGEAEASTTDSQAEPTIQGSGAESDAVTNEAVSNEPTGEPAPNAAPTTAQNIAPVLNNQVVLNADDDDTISVIQAPTSVTGTTDERTATLKWSKAASDHTLEVFFVQVQSVEDGTATVDPEPDVANQVFVTTSMQDISNGTMVPYSGGSFDLTGSTNVDVGGSYTLKWTLPTGYKNVNLNIAGNDVIAPARPGADGKYSYTVSDIQSDTEVKVVIQKDMKNADVPATEPTVDTTLYNINVVGEPGAVSVNGGQEGVIDGTTAHVSWSITPTAGDNNVYTIYYVYIDGVAHPELASLNDSKSGETDVTVNGKDVNVRIVADKRAPTNVDSDGDGNPDTNIPGTDPDTGDPEIKHPADGDGNIIKYQISFDKNKGTGSTQVNGTMENQELELNQDKTALTDNDYDRSGYIWTGWNTANDGTGTPYTDKALVKNLSQKSGDAIQGDVVPLYAQWQAKLSTITFYNNATGEGLSGSMTPQTVTFDQNTSLNENQFARVGYTFNGWNTKADGSGTDYADQGDVTNVLTGDTGDDAMDLYVKWLANSFTVKFNGGDGGTGSMNDMNFTYDVKQNLTANAFTKTGYHFDHWEQTKGDTTVSFGNEEEVQNLTPDVDGEVTLTAIWAPNPYTVKFDKNDNLATGEMADETFTYDEAKNLTKVAFEKTGYNLKEWNEAADGSGTAYADEGEILNLLTGENGQTEKTLYAIWQPNTYTVKFDKNSDFASGSMGDLTYTYDSEEKLPKNTFTNPNTEFIGWTLDKTQTDVGYTDEQENVKNLTTENNGEVTFYALWRGDPYNLVFHKNAEDATGEMPDQELQYNVNGFINEVAFERTGYVFKEWNTKADGTGTSYENKAEVVNLTNDVTVPAELYAIWTANNYTVTFDKNDELATGEMDAMSCTYDEAYTLPENTFEKTGYHFAGWKVTEGEEERDVIENASEIKNLTPAVNGEIVLKAVWEANTYTVKFDKNDELATGEMEDITLTYDQAQNLPEIGFDKPEYSFAGWTTDKDSKRVEYENTAEVLNLTAEENGEVTLYALYAGKPYTVKFDANATGVEGTMEDMTFTFDIAGNLSANTFTKVGYTFIGWNTASDGTGTSYADGAEAVNITEDVTTDAVLYAQWDANPYRVHFDGNGAGGGMNDQTLIYDEAGKLNKNSFARDGYTFEGWNTMTNGGGTSYADEAEVKNLISERDGSYTLYAQWKKVAGPEGNGSITGKASATGDTNGPIIVICVVAILAALGIILLVVAKNKKKK